MAVTDVAVILGTRPEAIKLMGILRELGGSARVVHTGQHYDATMWANVLSDLDDVHVGHSITVGGLSRGEQIGSALSQLTRYLIDHPARAVVVQGDTNSTLAGALAANAVGIPLIHVEAGLRSFDRSMPEETNRVVVDSIADLCCAPTPSNAEQLLLEGVHDDRICVTGNTLAEALQILLPAPDERADVVRHYGLTSGRYALATMHRASNVDDPATLSALIGALVQLAETAEVILPAHPRTLAQMRATSLMGHLGRLRLIDPLPPRHFLALEAEAGLLVSDSGGVQEEAALLRRPLLVLRDSTERPELLDGWCRLLGDENPVDAVLGAWRDAPEWLAHLATREPAYSSDAPSTVITDEIDARWPGDIGCE